MLKGYWQVPLTQQAHEITAFATPSGLYQYKVMLFGMKNAPATFQRMVNKLVRDIDGCEGYIESDSFPTPRIADCIDQIGNAKFVSTCDMLKGYWQVPLTQRAHEITAFVTPSGLYQYKVMLFGMKNAPATFQIMVNKLVRDIDGCEGYIDDVVIYSDNWSDHIRQIKRFFPNNARGKT